MKYGLFIELFEIGCERGRAAILSVFKYPILKTNLREYGNGESEFTSPIQRVSKRIHRVVERGYSTEILIKDLKNPIEKSRYLTDDQGEKWNVFRRIELPAL